MVLCFLVPVESQPPNVSCTSDIYVFTSWKKQMSFLRVSNVPVGELTCGFTAFWDSVFSLTSQQPAKEYVSTYKSFLQMRKTNLCWTQSTHILQRKSSDDCSFDSDEWVGAEFCPRGRGHRFGVKDTKTERRSLWMHLWNPKNFHHVTQDSAFVKEVREEQRNLCPSDLHVFPGWSCLKRGRAWNNNRGAKVRKKGALCGAQMLPLLWASSLPFNRHCRWQIYEP